MKNSHSPLLTLMIRAIRKAQKGLLRDFNEVENLQVAKKGSGNFVTIADKRIEDFLEKELALIKPGCSFLMEEKGEVEGRDGEFRFIIDPIDGTTNFIHALPYFCITVALEQIINGKREIIAAVTDVPILKETYFAEKGKGAWMEDISGKIQRLRVARRKDLNDSVIAIGSFKNDFAIAGKLKDKVAAVRCMGSTALALAYVAAGKYDALIQSKLAYWDMAAGILFVKEAGGDISNFDLSDNFADSETCLAANANLKLCLLPYIK